MQPVPQVSPPRFFHMPKFQPPTYQKPIFAAHRQLQPTQSIEFDGKRLRKAVTRKTVDYNSAIVNHLECRVWQRDYRDRRAIQPDAAYYTELVPPLSMLDNPINSVTTKFVRTSTNKMRCPIFCVAWTPEGRRLVTGASSGEFTLWNGLTFNFETILQAHDSPVRCMVWSHNDIWMVTGDHAGYVKYWQSNMNNVKMFQAHKEPLRGISFCPIDTKFATCSDDGTVRIWDFLKCFEEKILRGHGADVKCVDWHPQKALIVSGSKDSQQPIKLWDPKSGQSLATIHAHKNTVMDAKWNKNGNWLLTASRDHLIKLFDIRNMKEEMQTFRGHKKEATTLSWHPVHESLFASGGSDGSIMFWMVAADKEVGAMEQAHDSCVWSLAWHPLGHILCSGSNDHTSKFWTRNRPGDRMRDKYNLNTLPKGAEEGAEYDDSGTLSSIPGMGLEYGLPDHLKPQEASRENEITVIPGLDFALEDTSPEKSTVTKKVPFSKPIPKQFQQQWMESKQPLLLAPPPESIGNSESNLSEQNLLPPPPQPTLPSDQPNQFQSFQGNMMGNPRIPPPNAQFTGPGIHPQNAVPQRLDQNHAEYAGQSNSENFHMNMNKMDSPYRENYSHNQNAMNSSDGQHPDQWRAYNNDSQGGMEGGRDNGFLPESNQQNVNNLGRPEFYPNHPFPEGEHFDDMRPGPGRMPSGPHFDDQEGRFLKNDVDLRPMPGNHQGPLPPEEMGFNPHKRSWQDGPGKEGHYPPPDAPMPRDFRGPPMQEYGSRFSIRPSGNQFYRGRGQRGMYRGRSPYRIVNQRSRGGRGGYD